MPVYVCFDEDNDPGHESPYLVEGVDDPIEAAEIAAEMWDDAGDVVSCREILVEKQDEPGDGHWLLYVESELIREYRARLTMPDFVTDLVK